MSERASLTWPRLQRHPGGDERLMMDGFQGFFLLLNTGGKVREEKGGEGGSRDR